MSLLLAQAAVNDANIHFDKLYSYRIPAELAGRVFPGSMVLVPFGRGSKARMAVVLAVGEVDESDAPKGLKTLYDAAPEDARLTPDLLELVRFLKERTFCTWFEAVKAVIPYGAQYRPAVVDGRHVMQGRLTRSTERLYTLAGALPEKPKPGPRQLAAVAALQNGPLTARQLDEVGISRATLDGLVKKGELTVEQGKVLNEELKHNIKDAIRENVTLHVVTPEDNRGEADGDETDDTADFVLDAVDSLTDEQLSALKARIAEREKESASGAPQADGEKETDEKKTDEEKTEE